MSLPNQAIILLNTLAQITRDDVITLLSGPLNERTFHLLSDHDPPPVERQGQAEPSIHWLGLGAAVHRLLEDLPRGTAERRVDYHIACRSPLPVLVMVGRELSAWAGPQIIHNPDKNGAWHSISLGQQSRASSVPDSDASAAPFFDRKPSHQKPVLAHGWVAFAVATSGRPTNHPPIEAALGADLVGIEELGVEGQKILTAENATEASTEIRKVVSELRGAYLNARGIALFVDGPAQLAYIVGRELNPTVWRDVRVYYHHSTGRQELAFELPWRPASRQLISSAAADILRRQKILNNIVDGFTELKNTLDLRDLPDLHSKPESFIQRVQRIVPHREAQGPGFRLTPLSDRAELGDELLEAVVRLEADDQKRFGQLLFLHEVLHFDQGLYHSNYNDIGRAGIALEEMDFLADSFAVETAVRWTVRQGGDRAKARIAEETTAYIRCALRGMQAFDEMEHGPRLIHLAERRLRRYLGWHFQLNRAETLRTNDQGLVDLATLLSDRVVIELAPVVGTLDHRHDKFVKSVVRSKSEATELVVVCGGHLGRFQNSASLNLEDLLSAVRDFDHGQIQKAMSHVMYEKNREFVPWKI